MALEEQMEMSFGEVPDNTIGVDPVSGNEIPLGSTAENVRDDIPAQLSEGEMVIPADVVRFFGVKFFEDIRQAAKMGYSQMAEDGRIGGEPMDMEDETGLGLEMADLEVLEDDQPEEAFLGKFFAGIRESNRKQAANDKQYVRDRFNARKNKGSVNKSKPGKPTFRNKAEELLYNIGNRGSDSDDRRVKLYEQPPTSDDERSSGTIAEQINFGSNYDKPEGKKSTGRKSQPSKKTTTFVDDNKEGINLREGDGRGMYASIMNNLGFEGYDEGGDVVQEGTTGGFGEEISEDIVGNTGVMEAREYENSAGHVIIIMFLDGVPLQEIPEGYYPVGSEPIAVDPGEEASGGSDMGDNDNDGSSAPAPTPINYKELTMSELAQMVDDQKGMKGDAIAGGISYLSPLVGGAIKVAMWNTTRQTKKELERRRDDPYTSEVDKRRYDNLLEIADKEEPGLIATLLGKITGNDPNVQPEITSEQNAALKKQLEKMTEAYTPEVKSPETPQGYGPDIMAEVNTISADAAENAFSGYKAPGTEDDDDDDGGNKKPTFVSTPATTQVSLDNQSAADAAMGRPTSSDDDDDDDDEPTFAPPSNQPPSYTAPGGIYSEPGRPTKSSGKRPGGGGGKNKGGMMRKANKKSK